MDLSTSYLGMTLRTPLVPSASPLTEDFDNVRRLEDGGAGAIVLHSLFEEQITHQRYELHHHLTHGTESFAEALTYFPDPSTFRTGPEEYLDLIRKSHDAVEIPVIASLNGTAPGSWTRYATEIERAGADALELNIYSVPTDPHMPGSEIEDECLEIVMAVRAAVRIPIAVKLSPYYSNMAHVASCLDGAGANALVLFNRFYQPDIDLEELEVRPNVILSTPHAMRLPLRWIAILYGRVKADLAATSGIHTARDVLKMVMAGASVTMMCSAILQNGIGHIRKLESEIRAWMEEHEYESIGQMRGSMSQLKCPDETAFERAQYMRTLKTYRRMA
jgi:dihydroorotate dehydrogenase (fumarate)